MPFYSNMIPKWFIADMEQCGICEGDDIKRSWNNFQRSRSGVKQEDNDEETQTLASIPELQLPSMPALESLTRYAYDPSMYSSLHRDLDLDDLGLDLGCADDNRDWDDHLSVHIVGESLSQTFSSQRVGSQNYHPVASSTGENLASAHSTHSKNLKKAFQSLGVPVRATNQVATERSLPSDIDDFRPTTVHDTSCGRPAGGVSSDDRDTLGEHGHHQPLAPSRKDIAATSSYVHRQHRGQPPNRSFSPYPPRPKPTLRQSLPPVTIPHPYSTTPNPIPRHLAPPVRNYRPYSTVPNPISSQSPPLINNPHPGTSNSIPAHPPLDRAQQSGKDSTNPHPATSAPKKVRQKISWREMLIIRPNFVSEGRIKFQDPLNTEKVDYKTITEAEWNVIQADRRRRFGSEWGPNKKSWELNADGVLVKRGTKSDANHAKEMKRLNDWIEMVEAGRIVLPRVDEEDDEGADIEMGERGEEGLEDSDEETGNNGVGYGAEGYGYGPSGSY